MDLLLLPTSAHQRRHLPPLAFWQLPERRPLHVYVQATQDPHEVAFAATRSQLPPHEKRQR